MSTSMSRTQRAQTLSFVICFDFLFCRRLHIHLHNVVLIITIIIKIGTSYIYTFLVCLRAMATVMSTAQSFNEKYNNVKLIHFLDLSSRHFLNYFVLFFFGCCLLSDGRFDFEHSLPANNLQYLFSFFFSVDLFDTTF